MYLNFLLLFFVLAKSCEPPTEIENGQIFYFNDTRIKEIFYLCDKNYMLEYGEDISSCSDGLWSDSYNFTCGKSSKKIFTVLALEVI